MNFGNYKLNNPESFETPEYVIFEDIINYNIDTVLSMVKDPNRLIPHAKTHKSKEILKLQIENGITRHKTSTLEEIEVLAECSPEELILAYPITSKIKADRYSNIIKKFSNIKFSSIIGSVYHLELASQIENLDGVYIDLDTGMHRTGIDIEESEELLDKLFNSSDIKFKGIHGYDGHLVGLTDIEEKQDIVNNSIEIVEEFRNKISKFSKDQNYDIIVGGSWSFQYYLDKTDYKVSPGTWIYWDSNNIRQPDLNFKVAGLILGQVIDEDKIRKTVTVDIGAKSVSCDALTPDRFTIEGKPKAKLLSQNEEHGVVELNGEILNIGDYVLGSPGHACTVPPKFPHGVKINTNGEISGKITTDARDRK